ncbi:methionine ABC transporter permease [Lachnoclostridium phytofermentans]|uniref:Binding-protein-dependent transport systems inner membrane component n=1 Tax=Lachnoclostridium phytofermentans (strain ATCC 700394 / DSM 18823 / ISDg) TaxID=357809 RepID=A9KNB0_LACP7|nr:methionine ABC transporter permease [Lachnoclostridium phytofermentans]ABX41609.1 binding-protein-dependent transport systems inner membrane component [Lachnoclostridium phytofermentans ISDg]
MQELLEKYLPNVMSKLPDFYKSISETLQMVLKAGIVIFIIGLLIGIILTVTKKDGILQNLAIYQVLDKVVNFFRSIPFIILLAGLIPLTRLISGTAIGVKGAIVPLIFGTAPFFSRQVETALAEMNPGLIEAAQAMGSGPIEIIFRVLLKECIPGLVRATTITAINLISLTAMAGAIGAGGLGDFAIRFGYQRNQTDVTYASVVVLVLLVSVIQIVGNVVSRKCTH